MDADTSQRPQGTKTFCINRNYTAASGESSTADCCSQSTQAILFIMLGIDKMQLPKNGAKITNDPQTTERAFLHTGHYGAFFENVPIHIACAFCSLSSNDEATKMSIAQSTSTTHMLTGEMME